MLEHFAENLWIAPGPTVSFYGFPYPTRMAVVRLANGDLWLWSPIEASDELREELAVLGPVRYLIAPNKLHHLFLPQWLEHFPDAGMYAAPGLAARRPDVRFNAELGDDPEPGWSGEIDQVVFHGSFAMEEVVFFHRASRTAMFTDLIQRHDPAQLSGWRGWMMKADGLVGEDGSTPREWRLTFLQRDKPRRALRKVLAWEPERLVIAHGKCEPERATAQIERSLAWLVS